jgi:hypothetical protein
VSKASVCVNVLRDLGLQVETTAWIGAPNLNWLNRLLRRESPDTDLILKVQAVVDLDEANASVIARNAPRWASYEDDLERIAIEIEALCVESLSSEQAADLACLIGTNFITQHARRRQLAAGLTRAKWLYSGTPCMPHRSGAADADLRRDAAHKAANGTVYELEKGLYLDGKLTFPGSEPWCKCMALPAVLGFDS